MTPVRKSLLALILAAVAASAAVDPALLSLVPAGATALSGIQVEQSRASKFGQYVLGQMSTDDPGLTKFILATGFDPRRDLSEILVATIGVAPATQIVAVGRGVFNPARIITAAQAGGATVTSYNGVQLIAQPDTKTDNVVGFLDASTAVMGNAPAVKALIDNRNNGQKLDAATQNKVRDLAAVNDAWFVSTVPPGDFFAGKMDAGMGQAMGGTNLFQAVKAASGGVKFTAAAIQISGEALTRSDQDATALADVIRFVAGLVQQQKDNPQVQQASTLLQSLQLSTQASTLKISLSVPEELAEQLFVPGAHGRMKGNARPHKTAAALR